MLRFLLLRRRKEKSISAIDIALETLGFAGKAALSVGAASIEAWQVLHCRWISTAAPPLAFKTRPVRERRYEKNRPAQYEVAHMTRWSAMPHCPAMIFRSTTQQFLWPTPALIKPA